MVPGAMKDKIPDDESKLCAIEFRDVSSCVENVRDRLHTDCISLIRDVNEQQASEIMLRASRSFGLAESLELQAGFAPSLGHRFNIGQYFMSVNERSEYQFVAAHSEGSVFVGMQLASFYCYDNTTDGGVTILFNVDGASDVWHSLREKVRRGIVSNTLADHQTVRARGLYRLNLPDDLLDHENDQVLREVESKIPNLAIVDALAKPRKIYSRILERELFAYWDSIANIDRDALAEYVDVLRDRQLLREPLGGLPIDHMDIASRRRLGHFGSDYQKLFKCKLVHKLCRGDMVIFNNITWAHSASNWSPGSGIRKVAASFA